jgi:hypothetical protein
MSRSVSVKRTDKKSMQGNNNASICSSPMNFNRNLKMTPVIRTSFVNRPEKSLNGSTDLNRSRSPFQMLNTSRRRRRKNLFKSKSPIQQSFNGASHYYGKNNSMYIKQSDQSNMKTKNHVGAGNKQQQAPAAAVLR